PRRAADEEDVALSALASFCRGAEQGRFPRLEDRDDLWALLVVIAARKAVDLRQREGRQKRGGGRGLEEMEHRNGALRAASDAFRALEAERIALIHGPFFTDEFDQKGVAYFQERGFDVVHVSHLMPPVEVPHPNTGAVATPAQIYEWVRRHVPPSARAVFIGGNAVRAIGVIAALEEDLRRPILTANQVSLWYALRVAGAEVRVDNYGQLFTRALARTVKPTPVSSPP